LKICHVFGAFNFLYVVFGAFEGGEGHYDEQSQQQQRSSSSNSSSNSNVVDLAIGTIVATYVAMLRCVCATLVSCRLVGCQRAGRCVRHPK
jgi:hypothetical protein